MKNFEVNDNLEELLYMIQNYYKYPEPEPENESHIRERLFNLFKCVLEINANEKRIISLVLDDDECSLLIKYGRFFNKPSNTLNEITMQDIQVQSII